MKTKNNPNNKHPFVDLETIQNLSQHYPTPFHLYDEKGIRQTARDLYKAFSWNQGFKEFFAVKATPNPAILRILKEEGCGVDCATDVELMMSRTVGFREHEISFTSNDTGASEFVYAREIGAMINLDAYEDIAFLEANAGLPKCLSLRYNPGGVFELGSDIMDHPEESKFGMTKAQLFQGYRELKEKGVESFGLHAFLASNTVTNAYYPTLAAQLFELAVEIKEEIGIELDFINLSGGIGVDYSPNNQQNDIFAIGEGVRKQYEAILEPAGLGQIAIYTELGRFMLAPHGHLITRVLHRKKTYRQYVGVDASAVNLLRPAMYDAYHHITNLSNPDGAEEVVDVVGSLCENNDKFAKHRSLPQPRIGDFLVIHDTGAHGFSMGYNYNGRLRSAEILLHEDGSEQVIRRAETPEDYFATLYGYSMDREN
ncbi:diaminopimelate decarboxylase [Streptococcus sp. DD13]|uniref:diaminopimelate decarboxylase n=1 Tax=Streptococcus sp. DD13 TaxID=1777881 RepID=UPI0007957B36|nr:diaminopimelate decarboxylase [Streptococcus sp. DD13]KXT78191.1 Diaminopimelate decarboxylase [Streptococcus sp. DD13]